MTWRDRAKSILKKVGKIAVAAATLSLGVGIAAPAVKGIGEFLTGRVGHWLGISASQIPSGPIEDQVQGLLEKSPKKISDLFNKDEMDALAEKLAEKLGRPPDEVYIAVHASVRDLQSTLSQLTSQMAKNHELIEAVLEESHEMNKKLEEVLRKSDRTEKSVQEMLQTLQGVERTLNNAFQHFAQDYLREPLTPERLINLSRLQRQDVTLASRYEIAFDPDLYVNRVSSERTFQAFMEEATPDQNLFLVLGNAGMGKTWLMAHLSAKAQEEKRPTFFVPLKHGLTPLTSLFRSRSFVDLVRFLDESVQGSNQRIFLFLDGLDEMESRDRRVLLSDIASCRRFKGISVLLSCRLSDWRIDRNITDRYDDVRRCVYQNPDAMRIGNAFGVHTPLSIFLEAFTPEELNKAAEEYGLPTPPSSELFPLLRIPYILRLIAEYYQKTDQMPDPTQPAMLDLFADVEQPFNTILGRLGILYAPRDLLMEIAEQILTTAEPSIPLSALKIRNQEHFILLLSSGILTMTQKDYGSSIQLTPLFASLLAALILQKYQHDQSKCDAFYQRLMNHHPSTARLASTLTQMEFAEAPIEAAGEPLLGQEEPDSVLLVDPNEREYSIHDKGVLSLTVTPDGKYFVSSTIETVGVWNLATGARHYTFKVIEKKKKGKGIVQVAVAPNGKYIVTGSDDSMIRVWDMGTGTLIRTFEGHKAGIYAVAVSPDSQYIASGSWDKRVGIWELETGRLVRFLEGHRRGVSSVTFSPDGRYIISGSEDKTLRVWEPGTGTELRTLKGHKDPVNAVVVSPDSHHIISGSEDKTIRIWDFDSEKPLKTLKGHKKWVRAVVMSPDGRRIISGSEDKTVRVWELASGDLLHTFESPEKPVYAVAATRDGRYILAGSLDKRVWIWRSDQI